MEPRPGFAKATVSAWRGALEARGLGSVSINVRITAARKLAVEAADNGLLAPELAAGITRVKGAKSVGVRVGNWLSVQQAQRLLNVRSAEPAFWPPGTRLRLNLEPSVRRRSARLAAARLAKMASSGSRNQYPAFHGPKSE